MCLRASAYSLGPSDPSLQCPESASRTLGTLDASTWSIQTVLELLGLLKWRIFVQSALLLISGLSQLTLLLTFFSLSLSFIFNQICFTVKKNLTIYYCIQRNKPTRPSIQGNFIFAVRGIIEESYFQCKTLSETSRWYEPWSTIYNHL